MYRSRARVKRPKGKELQRRRRELIERSFAHVCETGDHRRARLRGEDNVRKRNLIQCAGFNLSILMRELLGAGTPRQVVDRAKALWGAAAALANHGLCALVALMVAVGTTSASVTRHGRPYLPPSLTPLTRLGSLLGVSTGR